MLSKTISDCLIPGGLGILSGLRQWEKADLVRSYRKKGLKPVWQADEKKWSALILKKADIG